MYVYLYISVSIYIFISIYIFCRFKHKTEGSPGDFPKSVTVYSACNRKFVVWPFVYEETNRSYPFTNVLKEINGLNGLHGLAHLWFLVSFYEDDIAPFFLRSLDSLGFKRSDNT